MSNHSIRTTADMLIILCIVISIFISCSAVDNASKDDFCTPEDRVYKIIVSNHERWADFLESHPNESVNPSIFIDSVHYEQESLIIVETAAWPTHPYGRRGYVYVIGNKTPLLPSVEELIYISDSIYCYSR